MAEELQGANTFLPQPPVDEPDDEAAKAAALEEFVSCLLYTSPSPRDGLLSRMPSSA